MRTVILTTGFLLSIAISICFSQPAQVAGAAASVQLADGTTPEPPYLVKDINTTEAPVSLNPTDLVVHNALLYFAANPSGHERQLWQSDGTDAGTVMLKAIDPHNECPLTGETVYVSGRIFFPKTDEFHGQELWMCDDPSAEPRLVKDIYPGPSSATPTNMTVVGDLLFFTAADATNRQELWRSDGTEEGTFMVKDIYPGAGSSFPKDLTNVDGTLYFFADDSIHGRELWKSDGSATGTALVKDIRPGFYDSRPNSSSHNQTNVNGTLFFIANDGIHDNELWKSDGTEAGTVMVSEISAEPDPKFSHLTIVDDTLYFFIDDNELWRSDGTEEGTVKIESIASEDALGSSPRELINVDDLLLFWTYDSHLVKLWRSDGTKEGTKVINAKTRSPSLSYQGYHSWISMDGSLFFVTNNEPTGRELWRSDGTDTGTVMVKDINSGPDSGINDMAPDLFNMNGTLFFGANDGVNGPQLWRSDGTEAGTVMVNAVELGTQSSTPHAHNMIGGTLYFLADDGIHRGTLWRTDGTETGTWKVKEIAPDDADSSITNWHVVDSEAFFSLKNDDNKSQLWRTDGTEAGTLMVKVIYPESSYDRLSHFTNVHDTLYFVGHDGTPNNGLAYEYDLWKSDGTEAGTVPIEGMRIRGEFGFLTNFRDALYFGVTESAYFALRRSDLWKIGGSQNGPQLVKGFPEYQSIGGAIEIDGILYFMAINDAGRVELWSSNGTTEGTRMVKAFTKNLSGELTNINGTLFFYMADELWKSDGTSAGTVLIKETNPTDSDAYLSDLTKVDGSLFFLAYANNPRQALWKSDGTPSGTMLVQEIEVEHSPRLFRITVVDDALFLAISMQNQQHSLWISNGTTEGTAPLQNFHPDSKFSSPKNVSSVGGTLFFSALDAQHGHELWAYRLSDDIDKDAVMDQNDNCVTIANPNQADFDGDGSGDACDSDDDNDKRSDIYDPFPLDPYESIDTDEDAIGNNADSDDDNDGIEDLLDNCPLNANPEQVDTNEDGIGDACSPNTADGIYLPLIWQ